MKSFNTFLFAAGLVAAFNPQAARISEPDTILYGRIAERVGGREFLITNGQLTWKLRTSGAVPKDYTFTTKLEPLGNGACSYRLAIPHQVLAYDLAVNSRSIGLTAAATSVQHLSAALDGNPLAITPAAVDGFAVDQIHRAGAIRIDLTLGRKTLDSDGDDLPDWWEDQNGFDKFDPADAVKFTAAPAQPPTSSSLQVRTFAEWRSVWFPNDNADLDAFGQADSDGDGVPNFLEYAFSLNPTVPDSNAPSLPRMIEAAGRNGLTFQKRANATDLAYQVESSEDLFQWKDASGEIEETTPSTYSEQAASPASSHRFFRVRVDRK